MGYISCWQCWIYHEGYISVFSCVGKIVNNKRCNLIPEMVNM
jgi:hypothetical protein